MTDACTFCEIVHGWEAVGTVAESDDFLCFYDKYPVNTGHALVIPKRHIETFDGVDGGEMFDFVQRCYSIVRRENDFVDANIGINDGRLAGRTIDHLHCHIIPRYKGDVDNPEGGVRGVIPEKKTY